MPGPGTAVPSDAACPGAAVPAHLRPTRISTELKGGRGRFTELDQGHYLAPRPVRGAFSPSPRHLRVALIGIHMMLLGEDDVRLQVRVGAGTVLEVVEPAGMVAYDADGIASRWTLDAELEDGAVLIWDGAPLIVADGANLVRRTDIRLGSGARALVRETLVLGRSGEQGGDLRSVTRIRGQAGDYLYEDLDLTGARRRAVGVMGTAKVMAGVTAAGWRPADAFAVAAPGTAPGTTAASGTDVGRPRSARRLDLAAAGAVHRALTDTAHEAEHELAPAWMLWKDEALA